MTVRIWIAGFMACALFPAVVACSTQEKAGQEPGTGKLSWTHISTLEGTLEPPNAGNQQTATALFDVDRDGTVDFLVTERTQAPAVVWYRHTASGWDRYVVEGAALRIEAGSAVHDIDGDGDLDVVFGGDSGSNHLWWWENPYPEYEQSRGWKRHAIKNAGAAKHHDQLFGDFDGDGDQELVFWNQGEQKLYLAEIPGLPIKEPWDLSVIYAYSSDEEPPQRGEYPRWKGVNEHEGLALADIDGDGKMDILGGGRWFQHVEGAIFQVHVIDSNYAFSRIAAGQLIEGGRPEVVLVVGDGTAPLILYQWVGSEWANRELIESVQDGHSLDIIDVDKDGNLDIFLAEMRLGKNPEAKTRILLGDGKGGFEEHIVSSGYGLHESRVADLDGDGDIDILGKPYTWEAPRLDIWLNEIAE
ncbi:MAG TPA: VCBS repeat-containing protein [Acidobacteriota bacterium]|nr:VCBS repeat-containing protein [Acidobacteriota bacterium]